MKNSILTLHPSELSSVAGCATGAISYGRVDYSKCYTSPKIRPFNLADLDHPIPARAYFNALPVIEEEHGNLALDRGLTPDCYRSICENFYHPTIAMPGVVTEIEPAFKSCYPFNQDKQFVPPNPLLYGVWDPNIVLSPAPTLFTPSAAIKPERPSSAVPGAIHARPGSPVTNVAQPTGTESDPTEDSIAALHQSSIAAQQQDIALPSAASAVVNGRNQPRPFATIKALSTVVTAYALQDPDVLQIGSNEIHAGGPAFTAGGEVFSLASNGQLRVGDASIIQMSALEVSPKSNLDPASTAGFTKDGPAIAANIAVSASTAVYQKDRSTFTATILRSNPSQTTAVLVGTVTLALGGRPQAFGTRILSLDRHGVLFDGNTPVQTFAPSSTVAASQNNPSDPTDQSKSNSQGSLSRDDYSKPGISSEDALRSDVSKSKHKSTSNRLGMALSSFSTTIASVIGTLLQLLVF